MNFFTFVRLAHDGPVLAGMTRAILISLLLALGVAQTAAAQSSSFVQLTGSAGCLAQTGALADEDVEPQPKACGPAHGLLQVESVAVSADGKFVYAAASGTPYGGSNAVLSFARDGATGALRQIGCVSDDGGDGLVGTDGTCTDGNALLGANDVALSPDGRNLYVSASSSHSVVWFTRDPETGAITQAGCIKDAPRGDRCAGARPLQGAGAVAVSPDGKHVYVAATDGHGVSAFARDAETGGLSFVDCITNNGSDGACVDGMGLLAASDVALAGDGKTVYVASAMVGGLQTFARDVETGRLVQTGCMLDEPRPGTSCKAVPTIDGLNALAISPDGRDVYAGSSDDSAITQLRAGADGSLTNAGCVAHAEPEGDDRVHVEEDEDEEEEEEDADERDEELDEELDAKAARRIARASRRAARRGRIALLSGGCGKAKAIGSVTDLAITPDGRSLIGAGYGTLALFDRDPASGALRQTACAESYHTYKSCSAQSALDGTAGIAISPDARNVYVASRYAGAIVAFGAAVAVTARVTASRSSLATVRLACPAARSRPCSGRVRIASRRPRAAASGTGYTLAPGERRNVTARIPADVRRRARVTVVATDASGLTRQTRRRVALRRA